MAGSSYGNIFKVTTWGESHGKGLGVVVDSGLRGYQVGGAQVSEKHCGFVINTGNATAKDVTTLMSDVQRIVMEKFGVKLEPEVKFLGEF